MVLRPDTRRIAGIRLDSTPLNVMIREFRAAFPKEVALCLRGTLADTTVEGGQRWGIVTITGVSRAQSDSSDVYHVFFPARPRTGCADAPDLVGAAHDHTTLGHACTHSYPDAEVLFTDPRLLFTLVFCTNGWTEALYQDGRRVPARWAPEP
jgi:hypothetical protein